jgi:hypothetical protein
LELTSEIRNCHGLLAPDSDLDLQVLFVRLVIKRKQSVLTERAFADIGFDELASSFRNPGQ